MVGTQQAPKDTDGCLKKIHVHVLVEGELFLYPLLCFWKLYVEWGRVQEWEGKERKTFNHVAKCDTDLNISNDTKPQERVTCNTFF